MKWRLPLSLLVVSLAASSAHAAMLDRVIDRGELRVCTPGDYKPFSFAVGGDRYEGLDIDLVQSLAATLPARVTFVKTSWGSLMDDFIAGKCDIAVGGISVTLERQKKAAFSKPYMVNGKVPLVRCADVKRYQSVADIDKAGVRVIVNPGGSNERYARANFNHATLTVHAENLTIFDQILAGKADVFVTEAAEAIVQQRQRPGLCAVNPDKPLHYSEDAFLLPRGDGASKDYIDQWLHLLRASGEFRKLAERWLH